MRHYRLPAALLMILSAVVPDAFATMQTLGRHITPIFAITLIPDGFSLERWTQVDKEKERWKEHKELQRRLLDRLVEGFDYGQQWRDWAKRTSDKIWELAQQVEFKQIEHQYYLRTKLALDHAAGKITKEEKETRSRAVDAHAKMRQLCLYGMLIPRVIQETAEEKEAPRRRTVKQVVGDEWEIWFTEEECKAGARYYKTQTGFSPEELGEKPGEDAKSQED